MTELMEYTHGINTPVLRKYLEHVTAHPEEWRQCTWGWDWDAFKRTSPAAETMYSHLCGTAYCLAGHIALGEGHTLRWSGAMTVETTDGRLISDAAASALGTTDQRLCSESGYLFAATNSLSRLWTIASELTQGEIEVPPNVSEVV